jgi:cytochrome c556
MSRFLKLGVLATFIATTTAATSAHSRRSATRLATIENVMTGMVHPNMLAIEEASKNEKTDAQIWKTLATNAALLNEAGHLLVDDGRSQGKEWDSSAEDLRKATTAMLVPMKAHDMNGVANELKAVGAACARCHASYRNR